MRKISVIITLTIFVMLQAAARISTTSYPYVVVASGNEDVTISDSVFYEIASSVVFPVNKYDLPENSKFTDELLTSVLPQMEKDGMQLQSVIMRGAASPEGKHDWNTLLGQRRLEAVYNFINANMSNTNNSHVLLKNEIADDYTYLLRMMKQAGDADYETVKNVVEKYNYQDVVSIKRELKRINGMRLWKRLLAQYFPELRAARVVLVFKKASHNKKQEAKIGVVGVINEYCSKNISDSLCADIFNKAKNSRTDAKAEAYKQEAERKEQVVETAKAETEKAKAEKLPLLSVKTNLLYDALWSPKTKFQPTPNVEAELYWYNGMFSTLAEYEFPWWSNEAKKEFFQIQNWQLEQRYYFNHDHYFHGHFVGVYGMFNRYDFALPGNDGSGVQGEGAGLGLSYGYVIPLGKKTSSWKLELNIKAGYYETHYDPYDYEYSENTQTGKYYYRWYNGPETFRKRNWRYRWFGPTGVGITISYDLLRRKAK